MIDKLLLGCLFSINILAAVGCPYLGYHFLEEGGTINVIVFGILTLVAWFSLGRALVLWWRGEI